VPEKAAEAEESPVAAEDAVAVVVPADRPHQQRQEMHRKDCAVNEKGTSSISDSERRLICLG